MPEICVGSPRGAGVGGLRRCSSRSLLAIGALFVSYPLWAAGRICGAPFPVATPKASALGWELSRVLPELPSKSGCWREIWRYPLQLVNVAFAFTLPQIGLWIWFAKSSGLPTGFGWSQRRWWDILLFAGTLTAVAPYVFYSALIPEGWRRLPGWTLISFERGLLIVPPALMLVAWFVGSAWVFQPRITILARLVWASALVFAVLTFFPWCIHVYLYGKARPTNFQIH